MTEATNALELEPKSIARTSELEATYALLCEASERLRARGIAQWRVPYPRARFERDIASGSVWCWRAEGALAATLTVSSMRPDYYPNEIWRDDIAAWYLTRFVVAQRFARRGVGARVLAEVGMAANAAGVRALRLDVTAANPFLERYYVGHGFRRVGEAEIHGEPSLLLERPSNGFVPA